MKLLRVSTCLAVLILSNAGLTGAQITRFWTTAGPEPMGHDIDPDFGSQREFFQVDAKTWVERFPDGFLLFFNVTGVQNVPLSVVSHSAQPGSVRGTIIRSQTTNLEYFVPNSLRDRLAYRLDSSGDFRRGSPMHLLPADQVSRFYLPFGGSMSSVREKLLASIPNTIDEHGQPDSDKMRWRFDAMTDPNYRKVIVNNNRIYLYQAYQGDWETKRTFGGCHLRPLYILAEVNFRPNIVQSADKWSVSATDINAKFSLLDGSDTKCSFLDFDVTGLIKRALDNETLKTRAIDAVKNARMEIPIGDVWSAIQGPFAGSFQGRNLCIYPRPEGAWAGNLRLTETNITGEVVIVGSPQAWFSKTCAPAETKPFQALDLSGPGPSAQLTLDIKIPYSEIRSSMLGGDSVREAGIDDIKIEPNQAFMTLKLMQRGTGMGSVRAVPIIPPPEDEGEVSLTLVFKGIPDTSGNSSVSALNGSYTVSLTEQIKKMKSALIGSFPSGKVTLVVNDASMAGINITCEEDGLHAYVNIATAAFARWSP